MSSATASGFVTPTTSIARSAAGRILQRRLRWHRRDPYLVGGADSYQLYRSTNSNFSNPSLVYSGPSTTQGFNVPLDTTWYVRAKACNAFSCSGWTNQVAASYVNWCE